MRLPLNPREVELTDFVAAFLTIVAFVPQLVRVLRLRSAREISLPTFLMFSLGVALWLVYGIALHSWPMIASNSITLFLSGGILLLKLKYDRRHSRRTTLKELGL